MGWFESEKYPNALVGDEPLDLVGRFLEEFRAAYLDGPERMPTVADLEASLAIVLGAVGGKWFEDLEGRQVVKLKLQTKRAAKHQTWTIGDIFAIPLTAGDFVFGRYIYDKGPEGGMIEVYGDVRECPVFDTEVLEYELMGPPLWVSPTALFETGDFPILRHDPDYEPEGLDKLEVLGGPPHDYKIMRLDGSGVRRFDPKQWLRWKDRTLGLRGTEGVIHAVERWMGRRDDDDELIG
jgi:hypothetical protein